MGIARSIAKSIARNVTAGDGGGVADGLLLDNIAGVAAAYSLRKLSLSATQAFRIRRASDNFEFDIGFVNGLLDTSAVIEFCAGANGYVTKWYDQSGNGLDLVQATTTDQPIIIASGTIKTNGLNGRHAIQADGSGELTVAFPVTTSAFSANAVLSMNTATANYSRFLGLYTGANDDYNSDSYLIPFIRVGTGNSIEAYRNLTDLSVVSVTLDQQYILTSVYNGTNHVMYKDGVASSSVATSGALNSASMRLFGASSLRWVGYCSELIVAREAFSAGNRAIIESNQSAFYGPTVS